MSSRRHRGLVDLMLLLATLAAILGVAAHWADADLLGPAHWSQTSAKVIARAPVRRAVSDFIVSRAFGRAGVGAALDHALPGEVAGAATRAVHRAAAGAAGTVLAGRGGRAAWRDANHQAVAGLRRAVDHPGRHEGVSLQLTPLLSEILAGVAGNPVVSAIPGAASVLTVHTPDAGRLQLLSASQVADIAPGVRAIRVLSWALPAAALVLLLASLALARGWRSQALSRVGYALAIAGGAVLGARALAQYALADAFVGSARDRAAVRVAWLTGTVDLRRDALVLCVTGGIVAIGSWLIRAIL